MKVSRYVLPAVLLCSLSGSLFAQVNDTYVIPVIAKTPGANGSRWSTELNIFNPQQYKLKVTLVLLPQGGGTGDRFDFVVPANSNAYSPDVLGELFRRDGLGALLVATFPETNPGVPNDILSRSFLASSKTFNTSSSGTFGEFVPGIWTGLEDYKSDGISAVAHGIRNFGSGSNGFRTSVGATNIGRYSVTMHVTVFDVDGRIVADRIPFTIPPQGQIQDRLTVGVDHGSIEFTIDDPTRDAVVFPYVTVTDNLSNGPVYLTPTLLASAKSLYFKTGGSAQVGRKIDASRARELAAAARTSASGVLVRDAEGLRIVRKDQ